MEYVLAKYREQSEETTEPVLSNPEVNTTEDAMPRDLREDPGAVATVIVTSGSNGVQAEDAQLSQLGIQGEDLAQEAAPSNTTNAEPGQNGCNITQLTGLFIRCSNFTTQLTVRCVI